MTAARVRTAGFNIFGSKLRGLPKDVRRATRASIRDAGGDLTQAVRRAASWSSRIPAATTMKVAFGARTGGVRIAVSERRAPHAKVHEFPNRGAMIRHPVFGNQNAWVEQPAHPFLRKTVRANQRAIVGKVEKAIDRTISDL